MKRNNRNGFTLVEMLVVIGIIAALAGLVLPAVFGGGAEARNSVCKLQLKNIGTAMTLHVTAKGNYPGYAKRIGTENGTPAYIGWAPQLFRYMDRKQQYTAIIQNKPTERWQQPYKDLLCPSANPDIGVEIGDSETLDFPMTYGINAGRSDAEQIDTRNTAIAHDHTLDKDDRIYTNLDDLRDGQSQTILMAENADLANWTTLGPNMEFMQGVIYNTGTISAAEVPFYVPRTSPTNMLEAANARPWSYHPTGFNVVYAGGHADNFKIDETDPDVSYRLFRAQMTPNCGDHETDETFDCQ